jgi:hypothetical protein
MQGRLQELSKRQGAREEEAARRLREAEERLKASNSALQSAHKDHQVNRFGCGIKLDARFVQSGYIMQMS